MLAQLADMIELVGLQIGAGRVDVGQGCFAQDIGGDVLDRAIRDFMNKADIPVFARRDPRYDFAPGDFRIDDGLAAAPAVIDHHDEILHAGDLALIGELESNGGSISENQKKVQYKILKIRKFIAMAILSGPAGQNHLAAGPATSPASVRPAPWPPCASAPAPCCAGVRSGPSAT